VEFNYFTRPHHRSSTQRHRRYHRPFSYTRSFWETKLCRSDEMKFALWHITMMPSLFVTMATAEEDWMEKVRRLQGSEFMQVCNQAFMSDMQHNSYLMSDFAHDVTSFCSQFATKKSICPDSGFRGLSLDFQNTFFQSASQQMGISMDRFPIGALTSMGDTGYIFSQKTQPELDAMRNDLCVQMQSAFGGEYCYQISVIFIICVFVRVDSYLCRIRNRINAISETNRRNHSTNNRFHQHS
jgi:hypothetical protein